MGGFFQGLLGDLLKLLRTDSPFQWELALQLALSVASEGAEDGNVDPVERMRFEELTHLAELHVADVAGISPASGRLEVHPVGRAEWARRSLLAWRPLLERLAAALNRRAAPPPAPEAEGELSALLGLWAETIAPAMIAMQIGSLVGHLAQRALGQYDLPLPRPGNELLAVPQNVRSFCADWSLPIDDTVVWLAVRDVAAHAVWSRPHVRERLETLLLERAGSFAPDPGAFESHLSQLGDAGDLPALTRLLGDPAMLGRLVDSAELRRVDAELSALAAVAGGFVEWVTDTVARRVVGTRLPIREAMRRRRVEHDDASRGAEALLGLRLDQATLDRGEAFVRGVLERGGEEELALLWRSATSLPTPAEVEAPGLWIERIHLPDPGAD